jgi:hypothetical protein
LLNFTPSLPPLLPILHPHSHASCLPQLVVKLPLVLRRRLSSGATICPPLVTLPPLVVPLFFSSGALPSCPLRMFVVSPLMTPPPPVCLCLRLSLHRPLSLHPSYISCLAGCCVASHYVDVFCPPAPLTLVTPLPLVALLICLLSTLAGCCVASNIVQNGLRFCRNCKEMQAKMKHPFVTVLGGPN